MNISFGKTALRAGAPSLWGLCYSQNVYASDTGQEVQQLKKITGTVADAMGLVELKLLLYFSK
jgi:hypothetical protein